MGFNLVFKGLIMQHCLRRHADALNLTCWVSLAVYYVQTTFESVDVGHTMKETI